VPAIVYATALFSDTQLETRSQSDELVASTAIESGIVAEHQLLTRCKNQERHKLRKEEDKKKEKVDNAASDCEGIGKCFDVLMNL
jgi:hypothetical protein